MTVLEWSSQLSVGFDEIDNDHQKLVGILNSLSDAVETRQDVAAIGTVLDELLSYTSWHFRHEERLMQTYGDPELFNHKQEHEDLLEQAAALKTRFEAGDAAVPAEMLPFLKDWLTHHILETDMKTGQFLAANVA
ncbi:MAG: hemerythrin family protein [Rhodospirillaceae bacterium]|jgi:hemerythrin|nr:hemerythrin family protein [Rhodospirillaceae bacterium]